MNIYVSGLSFRINDDDLRQLFEEYGEITSAKVITQRETGRSRGFGFVEMPDDEAAQRAIKELSGAEYDGRTISLNEAKPKEDRPRTGGGFNRERRGGYGDREHRGGYGDRRGSYGDRDNNRGGRRDY